MNTEPDEGAVARRDDDQLPATQKRPEREERYIVDAFVVDDDEQPLPLHTTARRMAVATVYRIGRGHAVWAKRAYDAVTQAPARRQIRQADYDGDSFALGEWLDRVQRTKDARHKRAQELPRAIRGVAVAVLSMIGMAAAVVLVLGIVVGATNPLGWTWGRYWGFLGVVVAVGIAGAVLLLQATPVAVPALWLYAAYRAGGQGGVLPGWVAASPELDDATAIVTPAGVAEALAHLGIATLSRAIREGWTVSFHTPPTSVNSRGYQAVFSLPMGVTPDMIANQRAVLARNLHRDPLEVWPAAAERAGFVDLWVANAGTSKRAAPEYPLLFEGTADVFEGVPVGVTQRGDVLSAPLVGANFSAGGRMGQGKSNLCRVIMLGAALDPLARLRVHVFAGNGDFDAYAPRLELYNRGTGDDVVFKGLEDLRWLYEETGRREGRLAEIGAKKVTRAIAEKHSDLRPIVALFSECHELFGSTEKLDPDGPKTETVGKLATDYATKALRRARKTAIVLGFDTQAARVDAIPPKVISLVGLNFCFSVKSWRDNDGFLGDGSFAAGIRATELRFNVDRGTCLATGCTDEVFEVLKTFFIEVDDDAGWDAAKDVIARALAEAGPVVQVELSVAGPAVERDHLADLHAALRGEVRVTTRVALGRLAEIDKSYETWTFHDLSGLLEDHGAKVRKYNGDSVVSRADVEAAITDRDGDEW